MIELVVCTLVWGASFVAQKLGADHFGPFSISCYRNLLAGLFLFGCIRLRDRVRPPSAPRWNKSTALGACASGVCLFLAMLTQQLGIERTSPGVSAFLTADYVLLVPVFALVLGRRARWNVWLGVALALAGTYLICLPSGFSPPASHFSLPTSHFSLLTSNFSLLTSHFSLLISHFPLGVGEAWTLLCAALFAVQILVVDRFAGSCDMLRFSCVQMTAAGLVALPFVFLPGELARAGWGEFVRGLPALLWLGVLSSGVAYTLQNLGQAKVPAALASIVMSLEGAFAVLFGWLILGDALTARQLTGCGVILLAVVSSQLLSKSAK